MHMCVHTHIHIHISADDKGAGNEGGEHVQGAGTAGASADDMSDDVVSFDC